MSPFRFKVLLFMLPLLLPIGRVEITGEARTESVAPARPAIEIFEPQRLDPESDKDPRVSIKSMDEWALNPDTLPQP